MSTATLETEVRPLIVAVVIGSSREGRFAPTIADWFVGRAGERGDLDVRVVDVRAAELPHAFGAPTDHPAVAAATRTLAEADAFVVVTPEYNHSYPGALKNLVDAHHAEWQAKPVAFVSYGGLSGGLRAVEHLRTVFAELHAVTVRDTVSFHGPWGQFDDAGRLIEPQAADSAAKTLLDQLTWWGDALRTARETRAYGK